YRERFGFRGGEYPDAEGVADRSLALPFGGAIRESEVGRVVEALAEALRGDWSERAARKRPGSPRRPGRAAGGPPGANYPGATVARLPDPHGPPSPPLTASTRLHRSPPPP